MIEVKFNEENFEKVAKELIIDRDRIVEIIELSERINDVQFSKAWYKEALSNLDVFIKNIEHIRKHLEEDNKNKITATIETVESKEIKKLHEKLKNIEKEREVAKWSKQRVLSIVPPLKMI